ncbi:MAG: c-type cytochrome [Pirellulales bacterium]|nr:c-type cytochrome [Pirellulales bacterium]
MPDPSPKPDSMFPRLRRMHVVFAVSSLALLGAVVWMVAADHQRQWKEYQETYRDRIEPWLTRTRLDAQRDEASSARDEEVTAALEEARRSAPDFKTIEQIWLPELTIDYHFRQVARFDRCTTCHQGIAKTQPGSADRPDLPATEEFTVDLKAPEENRPVDGPTLRDVFGFVLAPQGMLDLDAPTVARVLPRSPAAWAKLRLGDVLVKIDGQPVANSAEAESRLLEAASDGKKEERSLKLTIQRGVPEPYVSHPRLDLFVGARSPHPISRFGCTICHNGQGSATEFKFASHTPNSMAQQARWRDAHGWFRNADWEWPMLPRRFVQSGCVRCHPEVTDLRPSDRFPDPPAPKLLAGYDFVRQHGCFGCHTIKGTSPSGQRVGPDLRLEPNYAAAALELLHTEPALTRTQQAEARKVGEQPDAPAPRRRLIESLQADEKTLAKLSPESRALVDLLALEPAVPGTMRKVGPSLRSVADRLDGPFIERWIANPRAVRPTTRMPQFHGQHEHLDGASLADARRFEAVERRALSHWLLAVSQPVGPAPTPENITEPPSVARGKHLFQTQGCAACHRHDDFPTAPGTQGPDLSRLGQKYTGPKATAWLTSWIRDPARHASRTLMPNAMLEPKVLERAGDDGQVVDERGDVSDATHPHPRPLSQRERGVYDPAADVAAYLLASGKPSKEPSVPLVDRDLDELALMHLARAFPKAQAERFLAEGIPESMADQVTGHEVELLGPITLEKKLRYVGRRTVAKRGCFGCHDISHFETAQPIGPELSDWGRKSESLLAFNQVHQFLEKTEPAGPDGGKGARHLLCEAPEGPFWQKVPGTFSAGRQRLPDEAFYRDAVAGQRREGFIWQKLRAPRSFDYKTTATKGYNERLTMGRFTTTPEQVEAVATFVLGLVAQPPAEPYVAQPAGRRQAIVEGHRVLTKYACTECHTLAMERWRFEFDPETFETPAPADDFSFLRPHIAPEILKASTRLDLRGLGSAEAIGMPQVDADGKPCELEGDEEDAEGEPLPMRAFSLWSPAVVSGEVCTTGGADLLIYDHQITFRREPEGGAFARWLYPIALADARAAGANVAGMEAWGWAPPPLVGEGTKVNPNWLHTYLLNPTPIRPASVLRMPKYNLSSDEARKLVQYFAAGSNAWPPTAPLLRTDAELAELEQKRPHRLDDAMRILLDSKTFCAKCHVIGDYQPGGDVTTTLGPNLEAAGRRLQPDYIRRWLAHPQKLLPYTGMPVNFPPTGDPLGQDLFKGASQEQIDALVDLLTHYEQYRINQMPLRRLMEKATGPGASPSKSPGKAE